MLFFLCLLFSLCDGKVFGGHYILSEHNGQKSEYSEDGEIRLEFLLLLYNLRKLAAFYLETSSGREEGGGSVLNLKVDTDLLCRKI